VAGNRACRRAFQPAVSALAIRANEPFLRNLARTLVFAAPTFLSALGGTCFISFSSLASSAARQMAKAASRVLLDLEEGVYSSFLSCGLETAKPEKFAASRKRRPERPPAGTIACHTKCELYRIAAAAYILGRLDFPWLAFLILALPDGSSLFSLPGG
jgi:hypothetical protein